ncbi:VOC family protein [Gordonia sp. CPCC 205333]|uniref:VOC family protein n=1 Tax=Gordonia sp. CPCC 205333 TaxID=3140790 RepID=UPI003AF3853E
MTLSVAMITVDTTDPLPLARWWAEQTGGTILAENDGWFVTVKVTDAGPLLAFQKTSDPTPGKNRIHLDFVAPNRTATIEQLIAAGATHIADHEMSGFGWTILADPDGNQFCVAQHDN